MIGPARRQLVLGLTTLAAAGVLGGCWGTFGATNARASVVAQVRASREVY